MTGGDRRSLSQAGRALELVRANPSLTADVAALAEDGDWLVTMRARERLSMA